MKLKPVTFGDVAVHYWSVEELLDFGSADHHEAYHYDEPDLTVMEKVLMSKRDDVSYEQLMRSIPVHGVTSPLGISWSESRMDAPRYVLNGHHRLAAIIDLGYPVAPCVMAAPLAETLGIPLIHSVPSAWAVSEDWYDYADPSDGPLLPPPGASFDDWYASMLGSAYVSPNQLQLELAGV